MILESPDKLLMYHHDPKTFEIFLKIVEQYGEESNPFAAYKEDHGPICKYSKKTMVQLLSRLSSEKSS